MMMCTWRIVKNHWRFNMRTSTGTYMYSILYCTQPSILDFDTPEETATGTSTSTARRGMPGGCGKVGESWDELKFWGKICFCTITTRTVYVPLSFFIQSKTEMKSFNKNVKSLTLIGYTILHSKYRERQQQKYLTTAEVADEIEKRMIRGKRTNDAGSPM